MSPRLRKLALTAHVAVSVGWFGAVAASIALAVVGLTSDDAQRVRAVYLAMAMIGWYVLVPFSLASLATGLVQSLGTRWGLFRHYWVLIKLVLNLVAVVVLLLYMQTLEALADTAEATTSVEGLRGPSPAIHGTAAVILLLVALTLSVHKPSGMTPYGERKQRERGGALAR